MADGDILTGRKPGYLACIDNTPPLIFRFQINPEIMTEKRSFKYEAAQKWGSWQFDKPSSFGGAAATAGLTIAGFAAAALAPGASAFPGVDSVTNAMNNIKNLASALVATPPLEAKEGDQRTFAIDFTLDARLADVLDEGDHYGGSIEPDLFVLRSFVNPGLDLVDFGKWAIGGFQRADLKNAKPPLCSLVMVGLSVTCVMTDLQIKVTAYGDDGKPLRAECSVTLKEQTFAVGPIIEFFQRNVNVFKSYGRKNFGTDVMNVTPILNLFT
jgi:hypothetical protein